MECMQTLNSTIKASPTVLCHLRLCCSDIKRVPLSKHLHPGTSIVTHYWTTPGIRKLRSKVRLWLGLLEQALPHWFDIGIAILYLVSMSTSQLHIDQVLRLSNSDPSSHGPWEQLWICTCQHTLKNFTPRSACVIIEYIEILTEVPSSMSIQSLTCLSLSTMTH